MGRSRRISPPAIIEMQEKDSFAVPTAAAAAAAPILATAGDTNSTSPLSSSLSSTSSSLSSLPPSPEQLYSPPKRKRSSLPDEIPETPWRAVAHITNTTILESSETSCDSDQGRKPGEASPRSKKLVGTFEGMSLLGLDGGKRLVFEPEVEPVLKRRRGSPLEKEIVLSREDGVEEEHVLVGAKGRMREVPAAPLAEMHHERRNKRLKSPPIRRSEDDEDNGGLGEEDEEEDSDVEDGLEGVAYKPTPTQRYVRDQRKKQQIMEYRARELKEARERRSKDRERKRRMASGKERSGATESDEITTKAQRRMVHFKV